MAISYKDIRTERQWKASTGLSEEQFFRLVELFGETYEDLFDESMESRQENTTNESTFKTYADLLFFGLYSIKSGLTYDLLGLSFGMSSSNVYQNQSVVIRVLETTLGRSGHMPKRAFNSEEEFKEYLSKESSILVDATEQRVQRPGNQEDQKDNYSGKKKRTR
jgi:hypothetical protein